MSHSQPFPTEHRNNAIKQSTGIKWRKLLQKSVKTITRSACPNNSPTEGLGGNEWYDPRVVQLNKKKVHVPLKYYTNMNDFECYKNDPSYK
eukprot:Pgem_evm1s15165